MNKKKLNSLHELLYTLCADSRKITLPGYKILGDIVYKNGLTEQLIKYICMSDEDLSKVSGNVHCESYRLSIIKSIQLFWD